MVAGGIDGAPGEASQQRLAATGRGGGTPGGAAETEDRPKVIVSGASAEGTPELRQVLADVQILAGEVVPLDPVRAGGGPIGRLADAMGCGHLVVDGLGVVVEANDHARSLLDLAHHGVVGRPMADLVSASSRVIVKEALADPRSLDARGVIALAEEHDEVEVAVAEVGDGLTRWLLRREPHRPTVGPDPRRELLANVPVVGYTCAPDRLWTCTFVSAGLGELLGFERHEWMGDPRFWLARVHPLDRERLVVERMEALAGRRRFSIDYRIRDGDGELRWVRDDARPQQRGGQVVAFHGVLSDATTRHRSEELLESLREASHHEVEVLRARDVRLRTVLRVLAHDVRNPLSGAMGWLDTALRDDVQIDDDQQQDMLGRARADLIRLRRLLDDVVEGQRVWERGVIDVQDISVDLLVDAIRETTEAPEHRILIDGELEARVDPFVVERAVANLVSNAITHTPAGSTVRIQVARAVEPAGMVVAVEDDGPGVDDADKERIWEPFVRGSTSAAGSGLGLSIVRDLAELHGGRAWVEDAPGGGASFRLFIPDTETV